MPGRTRKWPHRVTRGRLMRGGGSSCPVSSLVVIPRARGRGGGPGCQAGADHTLAGDRGRVHMDNRHRTYLHGFPSGYSHWRSFISIRSSRVRRITTNITQATRKLLRLALSKNTCHTAALFPQHGFSQGDLRGQEWGGGAEREDPEALLSNPLRHSSLPTLPGETQPIQDAME